MILHIIEMEELETKFSKLATDTLVTDTLVEKKQSYLHSRFSTFPSRHHEYIILKMQPGTTADNLRQQIYYHQLWPPKIYPGCKDLISDMYHEDEQIL